MMNGFRVATVVALVASAGSVTAEETAVAALTPGARITIQSTHSSELKGFHADYCAKMRRAMGGTCMLFADYKFGNRVVAVYERDFAEHDVIGHVFESLVYAPDQGWRRDQLLGMKAFSNRKLDAFTLDEMALLSLINSGFNRRPTTLRGLIAQLARWVPHFCQKYHKTCARARP